MNCECRMLLRARDFLLATIVLFVATSAFAQVEGRVTRDAAMIWRFEVPVVAATAQIGTVLHVTARSDSWLEVVVPEALGGRGERGLIAASSVVLISGSANLPCRMLRGNPCSTRTEAVPASQVRTTTQVRPSRERPPLAAAPEAPTPPEPATDITRNDSSSGSSLATGLFVQFGGGGTDVPAAAGGALMAGVSFGFSRVLLSFNAGDWVLYPGDTGGYYRDHFDNGQSRCRAPNGQFASDERCLAIDSLYAYSVDAVGLVPASPVLLGGGIRVEGDKKTWFGSAGAGWIRNEGRALITLRGNVGEDYVSGLVTVAFSVAGR